MESLQYGIIISRHALLALDYLSTYKKPVFLAGTSVIPIVGMP